MNPGLSKLMSRNKLEMILRHAGRLLADHQVARFFKVPEEMTQTPCDFFGYTALGRAILIEAKMVKDTALCIGVSNGILPHQWNELCDANRANALALICWGQGDTIKTIDVDMAIELSKGRKSIPWKGIPDRYARRFKPSAALEILDNYLPLPSSTSGLAIS